MNNILEKLSTNEIVEELKFRSTYLESEETSVPMPRQDSKQKEIREALKDIDSAELFESVRSRLKVIYGTDDRNDLINVSDPKILLDAESVVSIWWDHEIVSNGNGTSMLQTQPFTQRQIDAVTILPLCTNEPFRGQPSGAHCSGFLVAPDIIATAGHCVHASNVTRKRFVFGYRMVNATNAQTTIKDTDIYQGQSLIGHQLTGGVDWALVRLDREVSNRKIVDIRRVGKIPDGQAVHVIGHPVGLPAKAADGAAVRDNTPTQWFSANLDTYGGNSGSPVFNSNTHIVEGILVRGETDFVPVSQPNGTSCARSNILPTTGGRGEDCTRTADFQNLVAPWRHKSCCGSSAPAGFQNNVPGHNNYEIFVKEGNSIRHHWWNGSWHKGAKFASNVNSEPVVFQNQAPGNYNYEVVVQEGSHLRHYWWNGTWQSGQTFGTNVQSRPVVFQNRAPGNYNYEVVVQEGSQLQHYWFAYGGDWKWHKGSSFGTNISSVPTMFQNRAPDNYNYEVVVREGSQLQHYWFSYGNSWKWDKGNSFGTGVTTEPVMFQNHLANLFNYELFVGEGTQVQHYWFSYGSGWNWHKGAKFGQNVKGAPAAFQNYHPGNYNYEVVVQEGNQLQHYSWNGSWETGKSLGSNISSEPFMFQNHAPANSNYELFVREKSNVQHYWFAFGEDWDWHKGQAL